MLTQLLDVFSFLSVLLRGSALALNSLVVGGVVFVWILGGHGNEAVWKSWQRLIFWSAAALALTQVCYVAADSAILAGTAGIRLGEVAGANFAAAGMAGAIAAAVIAAMTGGARKPSAMLLVPAAVTLANLVMTSHAAGRLEYRPMLLAVTAIHQAAAAIWVGGLPYLLLALARSGDPETAQALCRRFSRMALIGVAVLVASGTGLSLAYIGAPSAVYGTSYGAMVASKVLLLALLLLLGGLNFLILRRPATARAWLLPSLRRLAEAEVGIGFTVVLAAASLTSQPPAVDLQAGRATASEIATRMSPRWPTLETPALSSLSPATPLGFNETERRALGLTSFVPGAVYHPNTPADIAWSEYNHHWSGLIVLTAGLLAVMARSGVVRWARHWPLAFLALAVFLFLRSDPENWPLGPRSFWQSFAVAEVLQHRVFVVLVVGFAVFEWGVRNGRIASDWAGLVFPAVCAAGGALLLTHAHALGNIKEELFAELSHIPLALLAVTAGWSRWLELRLSPAHRRIPAFIWPICFVLIGVVLLNYRES